MLKIYIQKYKRNGSGSETYQINFLEGCRPLLQNMCNFHNATVNVLFIAANAVVNYAVSLLLATKDFTYQR